jgi:hypothetical protein
MGRAHDERRTTNDARRTTHDTGLAGFSSPPGRGQGWVVTNQKPGFQQIITYFPYSH